MTNLERWLEQSKKIRDAATPGPWHVNFYNRTITISTPSNREDVKINLYNLFKFPMRTADSKISHSEYLNNPKFIVYARDTDEIKDQMIAVMFEALKKYKNDATYVIAYQVDQTKEMYRVYEAKEALIKIEQLAAQALGEN